MKHLCLILALGCGLTVGAQSKDSSKAAAVKALVESQNYVFQAQTALPVRGQTRQLTTDYDLKITREKIVSALPYYGRAYTVVDPTKGGMDFTSNQFDYTLTPRKKGGWEVVIKPKDLKEDVRQLYLTISQDGYTTLRVISDNRDAISYNGVILSPQ